MTFRIFLRRALAAGGAAAVITVATAGSQQRPDPPASALDRLRAWLAATDQHQPGRIDEPLMTFAGWPRSQLEPLFVDVAAFLDQIKVAEGRPARRIKGNFSPADFETLQQLAGRESQRGINRLAHRAALFHTDLARFFPPATGDDGKAKDPGIAPRRAAAVLEDGTPRAMGAGALHWDFARELLDAVEPDPSHDPWVLRWYQATASLFAADHQFGEAIPHFKRARQLFPNDAAILVHLGCFYEALAAPRIQDAMLAANLPEGMKFDVADERQNLRQAADAFRQALAIDGSLVEARLRLGRVTGLLGNHAEALRLLEQVPNDSRAPDVSYFAALVRGNEQQALGHVHEARQSYEQAAALFPLAQSPRMALAELAMTSGDVGDATRIIVASTGATPRSPTDDPWWTYFDGLGGDAESLFHALLADFARSQP